MGVLNPPGTTIPRPCTETSVQRPSLSPSLSRLIPPGLSAALGFDPGPKTTPNASSVPRSPSTFTVIHTKPTYPPPLPLPLHESRTTWHNVVPCVEDPMCDREFFHDRSRINPKKCRILVFFDSRTTINQPSFSLYRCIYIYVCVHAPLPPFVNFH